MGICRITLVTVSEVNGKPEFMNFVSREYDTVDEVRRAAANGTLIGEQLHTQRIPDSVPRSFRVNKRSRATLPLGCIRRIEELPVLIYDETGRLMNENRTSNALNAA